MPHPLCAPSLLILRESLGKPNGLPSLSPGLEQPWESPGQRAPTPKGLRPSPPRLNIAAMPQSLARVLIHTVFSTQGREPVFHDAAFRAEVHAYLGGCAKTLDCLPLQIGGVADHVHLLTTLSRTLSIAEFVKEVKRVSTKWIQERGGPFAKFHWQAGYGCFSVSESNVEAVRRYIANQEAHHQKRSFQDEFRELLRRHAQTWDEQYVWD